MGYQDNFLRELVVDNFAGGGGASTGMELALGYPVDIAVNHDADAIAMHKVNHPYTRHFQEDVFAIDPEQVTGGRAVGIAWFSPDIRIYRKSTAPQILKDLQRWSNNRFLYRAMSFMDYVPRADGRSVREMYFNNGGVI